MDMPYQSIFVTKAKSNIAHQSILQLMFHVVTRRWTLNGTNRCCRFLYLVSAILILAAIFTPTSPKSFAFIKVFRLGLGRVSTWKWSEPGDPTQ